MNLVFYLTNLVYNLREMERGIIMMDFEVLAKAIIMMRKKPVLFGSDKACARRMRDDLRYS